jgi:hypothetical protein
MVVKRNARKRSGQTARLEVTPTTIRQPASPPAVLREPDAAIYIAMSIAFLRACRLGRGTGPAFLKAGRSVRYRLVDLDRWLASRVRQGGASDAA